MNKTRDNHYVPQWHQRGFFDDDQNKLVYLDLSPDTIPLPDGRNITGNYKFHNPTSRCFYKTDLYSTFFGTHINDEIERKLFGSSDDLGSKAVRAFIGTDVDEWIRHFQNLFAFIDLQKIRTPKGLAWLREHYPRLGQNDLMMEMQGIQGMHCAIWAEGVREIVSAEDSDIKFILTDHPVTVYNYAFPKDAPEPGIALKASQTLYPLNKNHCLILTNLEYAEEPELTDPANRRSFAKNYRSSLVRADAFIRTRKLTPLETAEINFILKSNAMRYIGAGREEWLYPEREILRPWKELRTTLLPPPNCLPSA